MKQVLRCAALLFVLALCGSAWGAEQATPRTARGNLVVSVESLTSSEGVVRWALYRSEESMSDAVNGRGSRPARRGDHPAQEGASSFAIKGLPFGKYALLLYHDEDGDNEADKRAFGLPKERVGISGYTSRPMRKPVWRKAHFSHNQIRTVLTVTTFR